MSIRLLCGDSRDLLEVIPSASVDSVVTDPPYALVSIGKRFGADNAAPVIIPDGGTGAYARASRGFMGKTWDTGEVAFAVAFWREVYRVLKPGGHVVAFGGTRSYHRLACAIEDAGFEIRDQLGWLYGTGFPKSHDVSKGIDAKLGAQREFTPTGAAVKRMIPGADQHKNGWEKTNGREYQPGVSHAATAAAAEWAGWGTALKPAWEPIVLARKPLIGTVAENVLAHGTGGLNIDGCRVEAEKVTGWGGKAAGGNTWNSTNSDLTKNGAARPAEGRHPANIVHDGSDEVIAAFPVTSSGKPGVMRKGVNEGACYGAESRPPGTPMTGFGDTGSAARFFYSAKASRTDRAGSKHPTVKPVALIQWLCRLVTPPGGTVLDPFAGSGTTGAAALAEGFSAILMEREAEYLADIRRRLGLPGPSGMKTDTDIFA